MKYPYFSHLVCVFVLLISAGNAGAGSISLLSVTGNNNTGLLLSGQSAAAAAFSFLTAESNVSISANVACVLSCNGGVFLMNKIGAAATSADIISAINYTGGSTNFFSGLNLPIGTYYLLIANSSGSIAWVGDTNPTIVTAANVTHQIDFYAPSANFFAPSSTFDVVFDKSLNYSITANNKTVPEPTILLLLLVGVIAGFRGLKSVAAWQCRIN